MKRFKSITINESTFKVVDQLTRTLLPETNLSKAQVIETLVKGSLGNKTNTQENNDDTEKSTN
jgi:hypothetical protein